MKQNPAAGATCLLEGMRALTRPGLRRYVALPLLVSSIVFVTIGWIAVDQFEVLLDWMLPQEGWLSFLRWLLWPLFAVATVLIVFFTFTAIANLIAAPFNSLLAEQVERQILGVTPPGEPVKLGTSSAARTAGLVGEALDSIGSELRKLGYFALRAALLLPLFLIPGVNIVAPFLWLLFTAWYVALEYSDYPLGNRGMAFPEQRRRLGEIRLAALGFGGAVNLLMLVPVVNFLAMPAAVAGATIMWHRRLPPVKDGNPGANAGWNRPD